MILVLFPSFLLAQWERINGPAVSTTHCLANDGTRFFLGNKGGVFQLNSERNQWLHLSDPLLQSVQKMEIDGSALYALVDETYSTTESGQYLVKGIQVENSWQWEVVFERDGQYKIEYFAVEEGHLFVSGVRLLDNSAGFGGFRKEAFRSFDDGQNWEPVSYKEINQVFDHPQGLFSLEVERIIDGRGRILHSSDWGANWVDITPDPTLATYSLHQLGSDVVILNDEQAFILEENLTWDTLQIEMSPFFQIVQLFGNEDNWYVFNDYDRKYYWSNDRGLNWSLQSDGQQFALRSVSNELVLTSLLGDVSVSFDQLKTLVPVQIGLGSAFETVSMMTNTQTLLVKDEYQTYASSDGGEHWQDLTDLGGPDFLEGLVLNDEFWINYRNKFYLSKDQGTTWFSRFSGLLTGTPLALFQGKVLYAKYGRIYLASLNNEELINVDLTSDPNLNTITKIATNDSLIAALDVLGDVVLSADAGASWDKITTNLGPFGTNNFLFSIKMLGNRLLGLNTVEEPLIQFNFADRRWEVFELPPEVQGRILFLKQYEDWYFLAIAQKGLFASQDFEQWANISHNLPSLNISSLVFQQDRLYLGLNGAALWRRSLSDLPGLPTRVSPSVERKTIISLFPNPASDQILVELSEASAKGRIQVFNSQGVLMYDDSFSAPENRLLDISHWPGGNYVVRVALEGRILSEQFVKP